MCVFCCIFFVFELYLYLDIFVFELYLYLDIFLYFYASVSVYVVYVRRSIGRQGPDKVPSYDVPFTLLTRAGTSASRPSGFVSLDYRFQE